MVIEGLTAFMRAPALSSSVADPLFRAWRCWAWG